MKRIYLDYAATTPTDPEVVKAMLPFFTERFGNPSSPHAFGAEVKDAMEKARDTLARFIGAKPEEVIFTSGGTESDNFAVIGAALANKNKGNHIITSAIEHHAVSEPCKFLEKSGFTTTYVKVDKSGMVDPDDVEGAITDKTILISIMHANNEIGTIQPLLEIGKIARSRQVIFHSDCVQTVGHIPVNVDSLGLDLMSLSAHKFYGPKGVGAAYVRKGTRVQKFLHGGDQENRRRASTHNAPGIIGMGRAIELCAEKMPAEMKEQTRLRDMLIKGVQERIPKIYLNGHPSLRLPNNVNFSVEYIEGESMLLSLDMEGIAASSGSACTSDSLEPSHVLLATGLEHALAHGSLRFTLGRWTTQEEIQHVIKVLPGIVEKLRSMSPLDRQGKE